MTRTQTFCWAQGFVFKSAQVLMSPYEVWSATGNYLWSKKRIRESRRRSHHVIFLDKTSEHLKISWTVRLFCSWPRLGLNRCHQEDAPQWRFDISKGAEIIPPQNYHLSCKWITCKLITAKQHQSYTYTQPLTWQIFLRVYTVNDEGHDLWARRTEVEVAAILQFWRDWEKSRKT
jgi:hypothetical protein